MYCHQITDNKQQYRSDPVRVKCGYGLAGHRRVAVYARVSTGNLSQELSLESQMIGFTNLINSHHDMTLVKVYADEGITGTSATRRPQFIQMIKDAEDGHFDTIMTKSISRFARNTVECLEYVRRLREMGINIVFQKEGIDTSSAVSEMLLTVLAAFAQEESRSISENLKWGIRKRFETGEARWCPTYGYRHENGGIIVCSHEADVVRQIFTMYLHGVSAPKVAYTLNSSHVPSPRGKAWTVSTVMQILKNEKYNGDLVLQKYITVDHMSHKCILNDRSSVPSYYVRNNHTPIIDRDTFAQVQRIIELKAPRGERSGYPYKDTEVICPLCGKRMVTRLMHVQKDKKAICCFGDEGCHGFSIKTRIVDQCILSALSKIDPNDVRGSGSAARRMRAHIAGAPTDTVEYYLLNDFVQKITFTCKSSTSDKKNGADWVMNIYWKFGLGSEEHLPASYRKTEDPVHVAELYDRYLARIKSGEYIPARPRNRRERIMASERVVTVR